MIRHKAYLVVLDYPIATTGDVYSPEVVGRAIIANRQKIDNRLFLGCFIDDKEALKKFKKLEKIRGIDAAPQIKLELAQMKRNVGYYKMRSNNISHVIIDSYVEGDNWVAEIETLPTGKGLKLEEYLNLQKENGEQKIKFRPVVVRERADGMVTSINDIVSIDAVLK